MSSAFARPACPCPDREALDTRRVTRKPLLLLPGRMCDGRLFAAQFEGLADIAEMAVGDIGGADSIGGIAEQVLAASPWPRFALAGRSMGGIVAMEILRRAPEQVERLALMDNNHLAETPERQALRQPQIERALLGGLRQVLIEEMKPLYLAHFPIRRSRVWPGVVR